MGKTFGPELEAVGSHTECYQLWSNLASLPPACITTAPYTYPLIEINSLDIRLTATIMAHPRPALLAQLPSPLPSPPRWNRLSATIEYPSRSGFLLLTGSVEEPHSGYFLGFNRSIKALSCVNADLEASSEAHIAHMSFSEMIYARFYDFIRLLSYARTSAAEQLINIRG